MKRNYAYPKATLSSTRCLPLSKSGGLDPVERDQGVTVTAAAAFLEVSLPTMRRYLSEGFIRRLGRTAKVSCQSLGAYIGYPAPAAQIKEECLAADEARKAVSG